MRLLQRDDMPTINMLINEFIVSSEIQSIESIPIKFLNYLRNNDLKIEDGKLINELFDVIGNKII